MIKAVIFDLDETLYDERKFVESGFRSVAQHISRNFRVDEEVVFEKLLGILEEEGRGHTFDILLKNLGIYSEDYVQELVRAYRNHTPDISPYPETISILRKLKEKYKIGLITDGDVRVQKRKIEALKLKQFFDTIILSDEYGVDKRKPNSFSYRKAMEDLGTDPDEVVYVGDNPHKDFITAKKLGIRTVRILRGLYKNIKLGNQFEAEYTIRNLKELLEIELFKKDKSM